MSQEPAPRGGLLARGLLSVALCGGLALGLLWPEPEAGTPVRTVRAASDAAAPASAAPEVDPAGFPLGAARRLRDLVAGVAAVGVTPEGAVIRGDAIPSDAWRLRDPDPRTYGRRLRALPAYRELLAWLLEHPDLGPDDAPRRRLLAAIDEGFRAEGLLPPFEPFREARPGQAMDLSEVPGEPEHEFPPWAFPGEGVPLGPWGTVAARHLRDAAKKDDELEDLLGRDPAGALRVPSRTDPGVVGLLETKGLLVALMKERVARIRLAAEAREPLRVLRRGLLLAGRSLREDPENADSLVTFLWRRRVQNCGFLFYSELADLDAEQALGISPSSPAEHLLAGEVLREAAYAAVAMGESSEERFRLLLPVFRSAAREAEDHAGKHRARQARYRLVETLLRLQEVEALGALVDEHASVLRRRPALFGWSVLRLLVSSQIGRDPEGPKGIGTARWEVLEAALERMLQTHAQHRIRGEIEELLRDLRAAPRP